MSYKKYMPGMYPVRITPYSKYSIGRQIGWYCKRADNHWKEHGEYEMGEENSNWAIFIDKEWKFFEHHLTLNVFYFPKNEPVWYNNSKLVRYVDDYETEARKFMGWINN